MIKATCVVISGEPLGRQERAEVKYSEVLMTVMISILMMLMSNLTIMMMRWRI